MKSELPLSKSRQSAFDVVRQATLDAGAVIMTNFSMHKDISYKKEGWRNIVTNVDLLAEKAIISVLQKEYPGFGIITEESNEVKGSEPYTWIIDPLDGTRNYAYGIPHFCICIALAQGDDVQLGVIYDPVRDEMFHAEKGKGAHLNGEPIFITKCDSLREALVSCDMGYNPENWRRYLDIFSGLGSQVVTTRLMGSAALGIAYAACGRLDLYFHVSLYPWDIAGGVLLVREAGGVALQMDGSPTTYRHKDIVVSSRKVAGEFIEKINKKA